MGSLGVRIGVFAATAQILLAGDAVWLSSDGRTNWNFHPAPVVEPWDGTDHRVLEVSPGETRQTIDGFGGCFNERGWDALSVLSETERRKVLHKLFDPDTGCGFTLFRTPIGASDYAMDWYSLAETPGDLELKSFSIERDRKYLIPYIRAALEIHPGSKIWASPWSPPAWMKRNGRYSCQSEPETSRLIWTPEIRSAYARYFFRFIQAYRDEGIPVYAIHVQNEPDACQVFPSCLWTGEEMRDFIRDDLAPRFRKDRLDTEIWLGTINHGDYRKYAGVVLGDPDTAPIVAGVGYQWDGKWAVAETHRRHPGLRLMQTESECGDGSNDHGAGLYTWTLIKQYFEGGANSYLYWNMVLDQTGNSTWGWSQNSLVTVNRFTREVRYNFEYYVMKHVGAFIQPGAVRIQTGGDDAQALAFRNPDDTIVVVLSNPSFNPWTMTIRVNERMIRIQAPAGSVNTVVWPSTL